MHTNTKPPLRIQYLAIPILLALAIIVLVALQGCSAPKQTSTTTDNQNSNTDTPTLNIDNGNNAQANVNANTPYPNFVEIINRTRNGTVNIVVTQIVEQQTMSSLFDGVPNDFFGEFFGEFFQQPPFPQHPQTPQPRQSQSQGSGFVINQDGYIVTNNHVVDNQTSIVVTLSSGNAYNATLIGTDPLTDLALIKIEANETLTPLPLGDSDATNIGEWVLAIGSPYGLDATVTAGIISAKDRSIQSGPFDSFLQTDASINPGNSGGPLINMAGEVIGINTAIFRSAHGLGFSIPINTFTTLMPQLLNNSVVHGWIGVTLQELTPELSASFNVPEGYNNAIVIADVVPGDPADKSGLLPGDVILDVNKMPVNGFRGFAQTVGSTKPGKTVALGILRNNKRITIKVTVGERPETAGRKNNNNNPNNNQNQNSTTVDGISVQNIDNKTAVEYDVKYGVGVWGVEAESNASSVGLKAGVIIMDINGTKITSVADFKAVYSKIKSGDTVNMRVATPRGKTYIAYNKD